jgi:hypothetical protein
MHMMVWRGIFAALMLSVLVFSAHSNAQPRVAQAQAVDAQVALR